MTKIKKTAVESSEIKTTKRSVASPKVLDAALDAKPKKSKSTKAVQSNPVEPTVLTDATENPAIQYHQRVEIAAYLIAERAGFCGDAAAHWAAAEAEVAVLMGGLPE